MIYTVSITSMEKLASQQALSIATQMLVEQNVPFQLNFLKHCFHNTFEIKVLPNESIKQDTSKDHKFAILGLGMESDGRNADISISYIYFNIDKNKEEIQWEQFYNWQEAVAALIEYAEKGKVHS